MTEKLTLNPKRYYFEFTPLKDRRYDKVYNIFINATKEKWIMIPSFDFYIVDLNRGSITGTNNRTIAEEFAPHSDDFYVIDVKNNIDLLDNSNIEEFK